MSHDPVGLDITIFNPDLDPEGVRPPDRRLPGYDPRIAAFGTADGRVYGSGDGGLTWLELVTGLPPVHHLLLVPD
jgi:hypothetical protein